MIDIAMLNKRISELETSLVPQSIDYTVPHHARIEILYWVKNKGEIKTEEQIKNKLNRLQEELFILKQDDVFYKAKLSQIEELKYCLEANA